MMTDNLNPQPAPLQVYLSNRYDRIGRRLAFRAHTRLGMALWRPKAADLARHLLGLNGMLPAPLSPRMTEQTDQGDHIRQRIEIQTEPGIVMPLYVLIPKSCPQPWPAVLALHGHCSGGKVSVVGDRTLPEVAKVIDEFNYDYGLQLVRAGFIVFCPDARGMGERQSFYAGDFNLLAWECGEIQSRANPLGQTVAGMWTWDNMRLIDYIESRPDCLKGSVGAAGLSGGGLQTLYLAAMDKRVRCAVISGYFYTVKDSILQYSCCPCNIVPRLWEFFDMGDLAALIAPRPLLIETGTQDPLNGIGGIQSPLAQVEIARKAYRVCHAEDRLAHDIFEGAHRWHGVQAIPWMQRWMMQANTRVE